MIRRGYAILLAAGATVLTACAGGPRVPPPELIAGVDSRCPLPLAWPSPALTPRRIRLQNPNDVPLVVVIEGCFRLARLADVPALTTIQPTLPQLMIAFPEGIRFHAFVESDARYVGTWHVRPTPGPSFDLVLDTASRARDQLALFDQVEAASPEEPQLMEDSDGEDYLMLPGVGEGGFLIFSCGNGRRWISLSTAIKMPDSVAVALRYDRGEAAPDERWEVLHSISDAVLAPDRGVDSLATRMAKAKLVNLQVRTGPDRVFAGNTYRAPATVYAFRTERLAQDLSALRCYRDLVKVDQRH